MKLIRLITMVASVLIGLGACAVPAPSPWDEPTASLAGQIAEILGPGQARLTIRNLSTISNDEIPAIRRLLEQDLKTHGVLASGAESANQVRVTLSENQRERLWVAEVVEGNETRVTMVRVDNSIARPMPTQERIVLRKESISFAHGLSWPLYDPIEDPVLNLLDTQNGLLVLRQNEIIVLFFGEAGWMEKREFQIAESKLLSRDHRGVISPIADGNGFTAFTGGTECIGSFTSAENGSAHPEDGWTVKCHASDDPWPIFQSGATNGSSSLKAFYNAARNYFTGVVSPNLGVDLPPFYSAALVSRAAGPALLIGGIDGKVQLAENGALKPVSGTRDWGSDFAVLHSSCGTGTQIIASGSGEAISDSLRAYELPAQEAIPASAPLPMDGTVIALWTAPDGKSIFAVVRKSANQGTTSEYEVDRVTASCN